MPYSILRYSHLLLVSSYQLFVAEAAGDPPVVYWLRLPCKVYWIPLQFHSHLMGSNFIITATGFWWAFTQCAPFSLVSHHLGEAILTEPTTVDEIHLVDAHL